MSDPAADSPALPGSIAEVHGIFPSDATMQEAIAELARASFDRGDLSLPDLSMPASQATPELGAANPDTEIDNRQTRTMHAGMAASGLGMLTAGVVVATGGAALPAVVAAVAGMVGGGALAEAASVASDQVVHENREVAAREDRLVLAVRTPDEDAQRRATEIMQRAGATQVQLVVRQGGGGISSAGWTG